ncbi:hypothetical protein B5G03_07100 [Gemmiger sp. An50]|nr:hypothetical protein B5G03_07100 [Gemmiger sp. An50]
MESGLKTSIKAFFLNLFGILAAYILWLVLFLVLTPVLNYLLSVPVIGNILEYPRGTIITGALLLNGIPIFLASFAANKITKHASYRFANKAFCIYVILTCAYAGIVNASFLAELCSIVCAIISLYHYEKEA